MDTPSPAISRFVDSWIRMALSNPLTFGSIQSAHATCQFPETPQPSYPLISSNTVDENKALVDYDHKEMPNNQEMPYEPSVLDFGETPRPYHSGEGSIDEINWDEFRSLYPSPQHSTLPLPCGSMFYDSGDKEIEEINPKKKRESEYMEIEEINPKKKRESQHSTLPLPCGSMFSDSGDKEIGEIDPMKKRESGYMETEEINPKKKRRRRLELAGEGEGSCKRCFCKKSKCLMLYCGCFAAGVYCEGPCDCINCFNRHSHKDTVLAARKQIELRKSLAFAPKPIRWSDSFPRHKRGCSCKKGCHMKYCGCYQGGVGCSFDCTCEGCKNKFGSSAVASNGTPLISSPLSFPANQQPMCNSGENISIFGLTTNPSSTAASVLTPTTTTGSSVIAADKDQSFGGSSGNVAAAYSGSTTSFGFGPAVAPHYYLQSSSLLANATKPMASDFPVIFQHEMSSSTPSAFGFGGQQNQFPTPFHLRSQIQF